MRQWSYKQKINYQLNNVKISLEHNNITNLWIGVFNYFSELDSKSIFTIIPFKLSIYKSSADFSPKDTQKACIHLYELQQTCKRSSMFKSILAKQELSEIKWQTDFMDFNFVLFLIFCCFFFFVGRFNNLASWASVYFAFFCVELVLKPSQIGDHNFHTDIWNKFWQWWNKL